MGMVQFIKPSNFRIDFGDIDFNRVLGNKYGAPAGKVYEFSGKKHVGKTLRTLHMAGLAQAQHNAFVIWVDLEGTWDKTWARALGMIFGSKNFYLIQPWVVKLTKARKKGKKTKSSGSIVLQSAELIFKEIEEVMKWVKMHWPDRPIFIGIDSVANIITEMQEDALSEVAANMRTNLDRASFLSNNLPRWTQLAHNYSAWICFINQIRTSAVGFGNPEYTPGGNALQHNAHNQTWFRRVKGGRMLKNGQQIGIKAKAVNVKNKTGKGSREGVIRGYTFRWDRPVEKAIHYMDVKAAEKE